ncbi:hypothetical protein VTK26DRAFT_5541 [Humicola hyalothermophila]
MRAAVWFAVTLLTAVVPWVSADDPGSGAATLPSCAMACLVDGIAHSACATDPSPAACTCTDAALQEQITTCVMASCAVKEALGIVPPQRILFSSRGVTKNITSSSCGAPVRDRGPAYITANIVLAVISCGMATVRILFKYFVTRSMSPDDYAVCLLVLFAVPSVLVTHYGTVPNGVGRDIWTLTPDNITKFQFYFYLMAIFYFVEVMLVKLCLLLFYLRIFPSRGVRRLLWGTLVFDVLFGVCYLFLAIFQCTPISHYWEGWHGEVEGKCLDKGAIAWSNAAISIALDFGMLAVPLAQLKSLKLHWKKKIGVALMFCVGTFVTVISVVRLQALVVFATSDNATYDNFPVSLWSTVEINVGIMCTCMPTMRLMLVRFFPALGGGSSYVNGGGGASSYAWRHQNTSSYRRSLRASTGKLVPFGSDSRRRTMVMGDSTSASTKSALANINSSVDTVTVPPPAKEQLGIVRERTYAVRYDDDETSLMQMRGLGFSSGRTSRRSDDSKLA